MTYSVRDVRELHTSKLFMSAFVECHRLFFMDSIYRDLGWDEEAARESIHMMLVNPDYVVLAALDSTGVPVGFFEFAFEKPWMKQEIAMCVNFYIQPGHRNKTVANMLLDFGTKLCQNRGARLLWASSTAGFSDNGCNERAFTMFLKSNGFRNVGALLVREFSHEQT